MTEYKFTCTKCNQDITYDNKGCGGVGYGIDKDNNKICYLCCAILDKEYMIQNGKIDLYLIYNGCSHKTISGWMVDNSKDYNFIDGKVTNWSGHLSFNTGRIKVSYHNIARYRYDVWFIGPDDHIWHGIQYGDNTQIVHCKRTKQTTKDQ